MLDATITHADRHGRSAWVVGVLAVAHCAARNGLWPTSSLACDSPTRALGSPNTLMQGASFATVGLLIATLRAALIRERGLSRTDPLTSLLNSRAFYEEATRILASCRRTERPVTVAYIDLDHFKSVNDRFGHQAGDDLLRTVARLLSATIRPSDIAARLGGDEFVVLVPETGSREAAIALERLRSSLADTLASEASPVTGSIGGVTFMTMPEQVMDIVRQGDVRMYAAKAAGRNCATLDVIERPRQTSALRSRE